jgi:dTDP-4-dehydrorhamnose 3,5-epimerase
MIFRETKLTGTFLIEPERREDERGFFARTVCEREFQAKGIETRWVQCSISFNKRKGTLRGLHYQTVPFAEAKLVRCTMGSIFDVIVDLRPASPGFGQHVAVILSAQNRTALYIPKGLAHGFQTLEDASEVLYQMSEFYVPEAAVGVRWNDPAFGIDWPNRDPIMSDRDRRYEDFAGPRPR